MARINVMGHDDVEDTQQPSRHCIGSLPLVQLRLETGPPSRPVGQISLFLYLIIYHDIITLDPNQSQWVFLSLRVASAAYRVPALFAYLIATTWDLQ